MNKATAANEFAFEIVTSHGTKRRIGRGRTQAAAQKDALRLVRQWTAADATITSVTPIPLDDKYRLLCQMGPEQRDAFARKILTSVYAPLVRLAALREALAKAGG